MRWKRATWLLAGAGGIALAGLAAFLAAPSRSEAVVRREIERIRAAGQPLTYAEAAPPAVPDGKNAATVLRKAFEAVEAAQRQAAEILSRKEAEQAFGRFEHGAVLSVDARKLRRVLDAHDEPVALAVEAFRRPGCRFEVNYDAEFPVRLHHREALARLRRLFGVRAILSHSEGRHIEVMACLRTIVAINRASASDGICDGEYPHFYALSCFTDLVRTLEAAGPLPDASRREIIGMLTRFDCRRRLRDSLVGERIAYLDRFAMLTEEGLTNPGRSDGAAYVGRSRFAGKRLLLGKMLKWLKATADAIRESSRPPWESIPAVERAHSRLRELLVGFVPPTAGHVDWDFQFSGWSIQSTWAGRDLAVAALSCGLYASKRGAYPEGLESLVPEFLEGLPLDPFTGRPFIYRRTERGFVVYSVGMNLVDDGGTDWASTPRGDDVVWEGEPPAEK